MRELPVVTSPSPRQSVALIVVLVLLVAVPMAITLTTVKLPAEPIILTSDGASPHGYTVSLLLWITPIVAMLLWLIPRSDLKMPRESFFVTMAIMFPMGWALDFFFASRFFIFPNVGATLGIKLPVIGGVVPVEELIYYFCAPMATLLLYIWLDEYWLRAYHVRTSVPTKPVRLHWGALMLGLLLIVAGIIIKKVSGSAGFPGYYTFAIVMGFVPTSLFMPAARANFNWRAFASTLFFTVLVASLWEVTLAARYGWWLYHPDQMLGFFIRGWSGLPVEEPLIWIALSVCTIMTFETVKVLLMRRAERRMCRAVEAAIEPVTANGR
jgi:hypothetical protein